MPRCQGFTLFEVLFTLIITSAIFGIALPALSHGLEAARAADAKAALVASVASSINRATLMERRTVLCPSADGHRCSAGYDWSRGWIGFQDDNGNREHDGGEWIYQRQPALAGQVRLRSSVGRSRIVFQSSGGNAGSNVSFSLCDGRGPRAAETLVLNNQGGIRIAMLGTAAAQACGG